MRKGSLRRAVKVAGRLAAERWLQPRFFVPLLLLWVGCMLLGQGSLAWCASCGEMMNLAEPLLAIVTGPYVGYVFQLLILLSLADTPFLSPAECFVLHRCGRISWFWGRFFYGLLTITGIYLLAFFSVSLYSFRYMFFSTEYWSDAIKMAYTAGELPRWMAWPAIELVRGTTPGAALLHGLLLSFLGTNLCYMVMSLLNLFLRRPWGIVPVTVSLIAGWMMPFGSFYWLNPFHYIRFASILNENTPLVYPYMVLLLGLCSCLLLSRLRVGRRDFP